MLRQLGRLASLADLRATVGELLLLHQMSVRGVGAAKAAKAAEVGKEEEAVVAAVAEVVTALLALQHRVRFLRETN